MQNKNLLEKMGRLNYHWNESSLLTSRFSHTDVIFTQNDDLWVVSRALLASQLTYPQSEYSEMFENARDASVNKLSPPSMTAGRHTPNPAVAFEKAEDMVAECKYGGETFSGW